MGTKATAAALVLTTTHQSNAQARGVHAPSMNALLVQSMQDTINLANEYLKDMEAGANKTAVQGIVTALT